MQTIKIRTMKEIEKEADRLIELYSESISETEGHTTDIVNTSLRCAIIDVTNTIAALRYRTLYEEGEEETEIIYVKHWKQVKELLESKI